MAYNPKTNWQLSDIVAPADMNRIEQGIADADTGKLDKTATAVAADKLATARTIGISGAATGTAQSFDGSENIVIPVTELDATKLKGTAPVNTTGNAATATKLAQGKTIALSGGATGTATSFDGSSNITIPVTAINPNNLSTAVPVSKGGTGVATLASGQVVVGNGTGAVTTKPIDTTPAYDSSNLITSGAVHAGLATKLGSNSNAVSATKLQTARTIGLGGVTATPQSFNGEANITIPITKVPTSLLDGTFPTDNLAGVLPVSKGGTGVNTLASGQVLEGNGTGNVKTREIDTTDGGTANSTKLITSGAVNAGLATKLGATANAASASKLATKRTLITSLNSTANAQFDGSADVTLGVQGTLPIANGGTGATTAEAALTNLGAVAKAATTITNCNSATAGGIYKYANNTTNAPATGPGVMLTMAYDGAYVVQISHNLLNGALYYRYSNQGTFGSWFRVSYDGSAVASAAVEEE